MKSKKTKWLIIGLLGISGAFGFVFSFYQHNNATFEVQTIQTFHYPALFVEQLKGDKHAGKKIFKEFCAACHSPAPLIDINAPHIGDAKTWKFRRQLGMDVLLQITINGVAAMPARGGCFECSDDQLRETIQYILDNSK